MALSVVTMIPCALLFMSAKQFIEPRFGSGKRMMQVIGADHGKR